MHVGEPPQFFSSEWEARTYVSKRGKNDGIHGWYVQCVGREIVRLNYMRYMRP